MKDNHNIDDKKSQEGFHSLINLDSTNWNVETANDNQPLEKEKIIYEKEDVELKSTPKIKSQSKWRWIIVFLIIILIAAVFLIINYLESSSQKLDSHLNTDKTYNENEVFDEKDEEQGVDSSNPEKQELTTSKISGLISTIIGHKDEEVTESVDVEILTDIVIDEGASKSDEVVTEKIEAETKKENKPSEELSTNKQEDVKPVSQWSKQEILDYYNHAVVTTNEKSPRGQSMMVLGYGGKITADDSLSGVLKVISPVIHSALQKNSTTVSNIPGSGDVKLSDLKSIEAIEKNGVITVEFAVLEQVDGPTTYGSAGPVGRAIGTLGNIDIALDELDAEISRGKDTVSLTYTDITVKADINAKTGIIENGRWHYLVNIHIEDADIKLIVKFLARNLKTAVDYTVTF